MIAIDARDGAGAFARETIWALRPVVQFAAQQPFAPFLLGEALINAFVVFIRLGMKPTEQAATRWTQQRGFFRRLGWKATITMIFTIVALLAVIGFLSFLWFARSASTWHTIMINGWATRSVSISALVLRFAVDLQCGVAGAMICAMVMESYSVRLRDVAKMSTARAHYPQPRTLLDFIPAMIDAHWTLPGLSSLGCSGLLLLLFVTTTSLQFSSTALLSDLRVGQLPGLPVKKNTTIDFEYTYNGSSTEVSDYHFSGYTYPIQLRTSTWLRSPAAFPAFAEFSSPVSSQPGVDDTGVLLRAFLPFPDAQSRETIRNYSGLATVLDSRVSCQAPHLTDLSISINSTWLGQISGKMEPSISNVERLWTPGPIPFRCGTFLREDSFTICQISYLSPWFDAYDDNGGLLSEFWNLSMSNTRHALASGMPLWSLPMLVIQAHDTAATNLSKHAIITTSSGSWTDVLTSQQSWSVSVCYSAFATSDLDVHINSEGNRTEPTLLWDSQQGYYTKPDVHAQMGDNQGSPAPLKSRGVLKLVEKQSWLPEQENAIPTGVQPFVQQFVDVNNPLLSLCPGTPPCSALLPPATQNRHWFYQNYIDTANQDHTEMFVADFTLSSFFHQTLGIDRSGSVARAMSSLITLLSSMAYYDQMPQFGKSANTTQVYFATVIFPQSNLGFWSVIVVLTVHMALVCLIGVGFAIFSQHTFLGNYWQSIAQLQAPETEDLLARTRMATDHEVKIALLASGYEDIKIGLRYLDDEGKVGLRAMEQTSFTSGE